MDKDNCDFEQWHDYLCDYAKSKGGSAADADAWRGDYEDGKTPEEAWEAAWGE